MALLSYHDALKKIREAVRPLPATKTNWRDSIGCAIAQEIAALEDVPGFANSAVDGFAVRHHDIQTATPETPVSLAIIEEIFADQSFPAHEVGPGQAAKIMTGAPVPKGADAVVMVEHTRNAGRAVEITQPAALHQHIRFQGEELRQGDLLFQPGRRIDAAIQATLASQGIFEFFAVHPPRVALLATGDELVEPEEKTHAAQIRNVNLHTLAAELAAFGCPAVKLGIGKDNPESLRSQIEEGLSNADMLLTSGGVSAGEKDFLPAVLSNIGMKTIFHKLAIKPGKPLLFGMIQNKPVFGLPGNVASALAGYHLFAKPAMRLLTGRADWENPAWHVQSGEELNNPGGRANFLRCRLEHLPDGLPIAYRNGRQGSGMLSSFIGADGLMMIPADCETVSVGQTLRFIPLRSI